MRIRLVLAALAACCLLTAQNAPDVKKTTATETSPASGKEMYTHYCAACHGADGKGGGPAAKAMKMAPSDLTTLAAKNGGKFPDVKIARVIDGSDQLAAHGSRDMPIWGEVFHQMDTATARLRVTNLTAYLQSLQGK